MSPLNELVDWISNQGFAIAVAGYLLIRLEGKVDKLIKVVEDLADAIRNR